MHEDLTSGTPHAQTPRLQETHDSPCTQRVNQKLPLVCFINGQRDGSGCREVERLEGKMMHDMGVGSKPSRFGWGCYRMAQTRATLLHMRQVIQSVGMGARGRDFTCEFAGLSSLPVNEFTGFRCNACLDQPSPRYQCCPEQSTIVGFPSPPGPHYFERYLQVESPSSVA